MSKPEPKIGIRNLIEQNKTQQITSANIDDWLSISEERVRLLWDVVSNPTNNPFMILLEEKKLLPIHQVYLHVDQDGTVQYVGKGSGGRADEITLRRKPEHARWMVTQQLNNYDYVHIVHSNLTEDYAANIEAHLIKKHQPRFNTRGK